MILTEKQKIQLEDFLDRMRDYKARHTELITVLVPKGFDINLITKQLETEKSTASNIKSTATRKNVIEALESLIRLTKSMRQTPENGVGLFAGNVSETEGKDEFITESFEPPEELNARLYRCDQTFVLDPLEEMLKEKEVYGLIAIDKKEAALGLLIGKKIKMLQHFDSFVPGKTTKGGQCLSPDTKVIINGKQRELSKVKKGDKILSFNFKTNKTEETQCTDRWVINKNKIFKILLEHNNSIIASEDHLFFISSDNKILERPTKELSKSDKLINKEGLSVNIEKIEQEGRGAELIDIETKNHNFIANGLIVHNSSARYARIRETMAKEFFRKIAEIAKKEFLSQSNLKGVIVGGPGPSKEEFIKEGNLDTRLQDNILGVKDIGYADEHGIELLVESSYDLLQEQEITHEKKLLEKFFNMLGKQKDKSAYKEKDVQKALDFGAVETLLLSKKLKKSDAAKFEKAAQNIDAKIEFVSVDTEEGMQFWNLGGVGAMLRFKIN